MNSLLENSVQAHGGIDTWKQFGTVSAVLDIGGAVWQLKDQPTMFQGIELTADLHQQRMVITSQTAGWRGTFTPDAVRIESMDGRAVEERHAPRTGYKGHTQQTPWDRLHALYFTGYALWTYLTIPFLYTYPSFRTEELPEWRENGEVWRRLRIIFPDSIASHSREQISYFGEDGLLRRHDYTVDVMGNARGANSASNYKDVRGVMVPMSRRVFAHDNAGHVVSDPLLVSIDLHSIDFHNK